MRKFETLEDKLAFEQESLADWESQLIDAPNNFYLPQRIAEAKARIKNLEWKIRQRDKKQ